MSRQTGFVPITEVGNYTDAINIYNLGMPSGFEEDRLWLHIGRTERLARLADIGELSMIGFHGETTKEHYGVGGTSPDGVGYASKVSLVSKAKTVSTEQNLGEITHGPHYDWIRGTVRFNNAEIEQRIRQDKDKWQQGLIDPHARAHYMDRALRIGITAIGRERVFGEKGVTGTLTESIGLEATGIFATMIIVGLTPAQAFALDKVAGTLFGSFGHMIRSWLHEDNKQGHPLPPRIWSLGKRKHYDRLALAHLYGSTTRLIAA